MVRRDQGAGRRYCAKLDNGGGVQRYVAAPLYATSTVRCVKPGAEGAETDHAVDQSEACLEVLPRSLEMMHLMRADHSDGMAALSPETRKPNPYSITLSSAGYGQESTLTPSRM
jgi:hypothetical protein